MRFTPLLAMHSCNLYVAPAEERVCLDADIRRSYRSGILPSPPLRSPQKSLRVPSYRWSRSALASLCLLSMLLGTQSSQ
jgi:hypothetical protein